MIYFDLFTWNNLEVRQKKQMYHRFGLLKKGHTERKEHDDACANDVSYQQRLYCRSVTCKETRGQVIHCQITRIRLLGPEAYNKKIIIH